MDRDDFLWGLMAGMIGALAGATGGLVIASLLTGFWGWWPW